MDPYPFQEEETEIQYTHLDRLLKELCNTLCLLRYPHLYRKPDRHPHLYTESQYGRPEMRDCSEECEYGYSCYQERG